MVESFPCTPDGNCFAVISNLPDFNLRMAAPGNALFEPKVINVKKNQSCESLVFKLKGFSLEISVKLQDTNRELLPGPEDTYVRLVNDKGQEQVGQTNALGIVAFDEVTISGSKFGVDIGIPKLKDKSLYKIK